jgi:hypothetical protein
MAAKAGWLALLLYLANFGQARPARSSAAHVYERTEAKNRFWYLTMANGLRLPDL